MSEIKLPPPYSVEHQKGLDDFNLYTESQLLACVSQAVREAGQKLLAEFPLFDDNGLDEEKHCCEWSLQQDRKRLHSIIAAAQEAK